MKGKIGLVVGLGVGYVLGTRAGRERYEQIKTQWLKVWHLAPVQEQVERVKSYAGDKAAAVPGAVWTGVVKVAKSVSGNATPGQKLDAAMDPTKNPAGDVVKADVTKAADEVVTKAKTTSAVAKEAEAKKPAAKKPAAKSTPNKTGA